MIIPLVAVVVLALSMNHDVRWVLIGADYTRRLFITISVFVVLTFINGIFATIRRAWTVGAASALLFLAWLFVGVVNSAV
jgi:hypothetical protein